MCRSTCWYFTTTWYQQQPTTPLFICTLLAPTTAIQIKELDYCHHPQIDFCCLGFLDVSDRILIWSSLITRDIRRVSLVVLLLRSITRLFFTHILTHTIQNAFLILWQIFSNSFVLHDQQHCSGKLLSDILPARKRLGRPPTTISVSILYRTWSWLCSVLGSVMMRCNTHQGVWFLLGILTILRRCPIFTKNILLFPVFGRAYS